MKFKSIKLLVSILVIVAMFTGCNSITMGAIPDEDGVNYDITQGMGEVDVPGSSAVLLNIQGDIGEGYGGTNTYPNGNTEDTAKDMYNCWYDRCSGHESVEEQCETTFTIDMSFVGDCMLATYKGEVYDGSFSWYAKNQDPSYFLSKVYDIFSTDDFTIVNLENVLTDSKLKEVTKDHSPAYWFRGPTKNTEILKAGSVEIVSLANNHFSDYGEQGRQDTRAALDNAGIPWGWNDKTVYFEKDGFRIALICHGLWAEWQAGDIVPRIKAASEQSDYQIVFFHGGTERLHAPEDWKVRAAHKLVDAGADLVIGNHPHVLQPTEVYNGVNIVYSLGNFCYGGSKNPENRTIIYKMLLTIDKSNGTLINEEVILIPCYVYTGNTNNWQPCPIEDANDSQLVLDFMAGDRSQPY